MNPQVGAASTHVRDLLTAPPQPRHRAPRRPRPRRGRGRRDGSSCWCARRARRPLPCTVVVPALDPDAAGRPGPALVGGGRLVLGGRSLTVVRWWEPARVRAGTVGRPAAGAGCTAQRAGRRHAPRPARRAPRRWPPATPRRPDAPRGVLGRGGGSTPDADDAVAGRAPGRPGPGHAVPQREALWRPWPPGRAGRLLAHDPAVGRAAACRCRRVRGAGARAAPGCADRPTRRRRCSGSVRRPGAPRSRG